MYFLSDIEQKYLLYQLLPTARDVGVNKELRGWSWHQPPLKPYYDNVKLPMYAVCSKYCPTGRDVYLRYVAKILPVLNSKVALGKIIHGVVSDCLRAFIRRCNLDFDSWWSSVRWSEIPDKPENLREPSRLVWEFVYKLCEARLAEVSSRQPYASELDLIASAAPFLVEHKISGELLGLSGILSLDCYDYLKAIMFDLKVASEPQEWHRLSPVGYALVFESIHEVPVDVCCIVYLDVKDGKVSVRRDLFFASDELRQWWIEERDRKLEIVAEGKDPGMPERSQCSEDCMYFKVCYE
ncbi:MAG: type I-A CRISPR-associated protein Cas4/Csa1 [Nitrososphaerota archaeon]|nr:type I-A CRISPR-associated protein Cas4/Csa1 [Nitrososphaerota archaeon]